MERFTQVNIQDWNGRLVRTVWWDGPKSVKEAKTRLKKDYRILGVFHCHVSGMKNLTCMVDMENEEVLKPGQFYKFEITGSVGTFQLPIESSLLMDSIRSIQYIVLVFLESKQIFWKLSVRMLLILKRYQMKFSQTWYA